MKKLFLTGLASGSLLLLTACGTQQPTTLYYWGNNNADVYQRLKSDGKPLGEQINNMEKYFQEAAKKQQSPAPGAHAHLGLLLNDAGQTRQAQSEFEAEKAQFPESSAFMDFLLKKYKGANK
ncbi:DUF4810 domain-containing protein [Neisseria sp. ZJ106]|uniref:DUF4810 domain-containing protein n=1 Tax=Neisseria lisongii TaxID=2912188 RepID=A0ABY7RI67_9NEIS|nr:DUF4810 domain-containing protein [Neisseria lisongii]MCF7521970.1 DUF4810 domain-containing protein [Neisseria lisongii]WCL71344.1 DUF4810 domain-containing protein [Neisseria lisongii]